MGPYYGFGIGDVIPARGGGTTLSPGAKDALMYAGAGVVGALIARNLIRGAVGLLLGASGGVAVAALAIAHPRSSSL